AGRPERLSGELPDASGGRLRLRRGCEAPFRGLCPPELSLTASQGPEGLPLVLLHPSLDHRFEFLNRGCLGNRWAVFIDRRGLIRGVFRDGKQGAGGKVD